MPPPVSPHPEIDIEADLNLVDDDGLIVAHLPMGEHKHKVGVTIAVGREGFWCLAIIEKIENDIVFLRQTS